jgi:predicted SAM-dependent methyltransferase
MLKYITTAVALKAFSFTPQTKRAYRKLGNVMGQKKRIQTGLNQKYLGRARKFLELIEKHHAVQPGDQLLEVGTGWLHWESTLLRLFYDVKITLFDVWDNRQLDAYKRFFSQFDQVMDEELKLEPAQSERAHALLKKVLRAQSFDGVYDVLDFRYVVNPTGTLDQFEDGTFSLIFSCNVLEHVEKHILPGFIKDYYRVLKPGGHSIEMIDLGDHLYYYDTTVSPKNYLRYSDKVWKRYFQNDVQYINRVQRPDWLALYHSAGFETVEEESISKDIGSIKIDESYKHLDHQNLQCVTLWVIHEKAEVRDVVSAG